MLAKGYTEIQRIIDTEPIQTWYIQAQTKTILGIYYGLNDYLQIIVH